MKKRARQRRTRVRIRGNARALMWLSRDIRRRWYLYGENRKEAKLHTECELCGEPASEIDHIDPVGARPRIPEHLVGYWYRMFYNKCQALCGKCHTLKTASDRLKSKPSKAPGGDDGSES